MQSNTAPALYPKLGELLSLYRLNDFLTCSSNARSNYLGSDVGFLPFFSFSINFKSPVNIHFAKHQNICSNERTTLIEVGALKPSQSLIVVSL